MTLKNRREDKAVQDPWHQSFNLALNTNGWRGTSLFPIGSAPGLAEGGALTISGDLVLDALSTSIFELGQAGSVGGAFNDLFAVGGSAVIDAALSVNNGARAGVALKF